MIRRELAFSAQGPFDDEERAVIRDVVRAVEEVDRPGSVQLLDEVEQQIGRLDRFGELLCEYPSLFAKRSLGSRERNIRSLVDILARSSPSNFDMFVPARAIMSRTLVMGEVNFYRLLRFVCSESLPEDLARTMAARVDGRLCHALYARLAEAVLTNIACDAAVSRSLREKAVLSLMQLWDHTTYRVSDFFPVLEATWDARRRLPATFGTLMGTSEMFALVQSGCDERFVDYLARPDHTEDEAAAFREFLFGATTEELERIEAELRSSGRDAVAPDEVKGNGKVRDACARGGDPALALFEFFLSRHLQASARRQANLPGPKRTAEEYVMLYYLERNVDVEQLSMPPSR